MLLRPGDTIANCRILALCGSGGMGVVYLAEDFLHRKVALKIVAVTNAQREFRGIQQYAQIAGRLSGMVRIFHAEILQDQLVYTMEAADPLNPDDPQYSPKTLAAILKQQGRISPKQALEIIRGLGEGLHQLHEAHLLHRDIKPENVIFVNGVPKFCDPGLICFQDASVSFFGTLGYLPRECFSGENLNTPDRDLYALGMLFYVAVTGEVPARYPRLPLSIHITARKKLWPLLLRVCNSNPKLRFSSTAEFLEALPREIPDPNWLDKLCEAFREYLLMHPRFLFRFAVAILVLLIGSIGFTVYQVHRVRERTVYRNQCSQQCALSEQKLKENSESLFTQVEDQCGKPMAEKYGKILKTLPNDPIVRLRQLQSVEKDLTALSLRMVPEIPEKTDDAAGERLSSQIRSLLSSPLGKWLPEEKCGELKKKVAELERIHITKKTSLVPGKNYFPGFDFSKCFVYVPAGVYRDRHGKIVHIRHAFWCGNTEISTAVFSRMLGEKWLTSNRDLPQVRIGWNDLMDFCRAMTLYYRNAGILPDGYIIRPLTTREWHWVYRNTWSGVRKETVKANPSGWAYPVYSGDPNLLGVYNMLGNVSEITLPAEKERLPNTVYLCGSHYRFTATSVPPPEKYLKFQYIPPFVGSRVAVARGNLDFFEREHWYMEDRPLFWKNRIYQCFDANAALFTLTDALEFCELLGGHLTVPDDPGLRKKMKEVFWEIQDFPVAVDAAVKEGKLVTLSGKPYQHLKAPKPSAKKDLMLSFRGYRILFGPDVRCCGFLCDWSKEEYAKRIDLARILKSRRVVHTFRTDNKMYVLVRSRKIVIYTVRHIAMLLGAKLAEPTTPEIRERFRKELAPWKHLPVFLGGSWKYDKWVLADGSELKIELKKQDFQCSSSLNDAAPGLQNGEFGTLQAAQGFLLEFPLQ